MTRIPGQHVARLSIKMAPAAMAGNAPSYPVVSLQLPPALLSFRHHSQSFITRSPPSSPALHRSKSRAQLQVLFEACPRLNRPSLVKVDMMVEIAALKVGFLTLPAEVRFKIYHLVFKNGRTPLIPGFSLQDKQPVHMYVTELSTQLLRTCSTIYVEARPALYSNNSFRLQQTTDFHLIEQAAGDAVGHITEICFQTRCKMTKPRPNKLKVFTGLKTVTISHNQDDSVLGFDRSHMESQAVDHLSDISQDLVDCIRARPDLSYRLRIAHSKYQWKVGIPCSHS